jgi:ketosteroid isomerase-like protein
MSRENVDLVRSLLPPPEVDLAVNFRDDGRWALLSAGLGTALAPDFKAAARGYLQAGGETFDGLAGFRSMWLEWLIPWESYRTEVEELIDLGDMVLVLVRDFGLHEGETSEVAIRSAAVWSVKEGRVSEITFYADRAKALDTLGLAGR